jgi:hypothetical protein
MGIGQIFINPPKGIINTTTAIPRGVHNILVSLHEGFQNLPKAYGSEVRPAGKVSGFKDGVREGAKVRADLLLDSTQLVRADLTWSPFFSHLYLRRGCSGVTPTAVRQLSSFLLSLNDAHIPALLFYHLKVAGLVKEPLEGGKKEGLMGVIKVSARQAFFSRQIADSLYPIALFSSKGAGRSYVNVTLKPAAGIVGVVAHPFVFSFLIWTLARPSRSYAHRSSYSALSS